MFLFHAPAAKPAVHSFPTRRSSDLFETTDCINFTPRSNCWNPLIQTNGIIQATGLTVGSTYRLMLDGYAMRSEEHTSELQSQSNLVCRLLLEKKKYTAFPSLIRSPA